MKHKERNSRLLLDAKDNWLRLECCLPLSPLRRSLTLVILAAVTIWGGPELLRFVQMLLGQG
jgi:hypothetical protein